MLLLSAAGVFPARSQTALPAEKKRAMHKLDPMDILPQAGEREQNKERKKPPRMSKPSSAEPSDNFSAANPTPSAVVAAANPAATPTPTPLPQVTPLLTTTAEPVATPAKLSETQSTDPPAAPQNGAVKSAYASVFNIRMSLPVVLTLFCLLLLTLIVAIFKLKNLLRAP